MMTNINKYYKCRSILQLIKDKNYITRIIFDICGTIFIENTTVALLNQIASKNLLLFLKIRIWHTIAFIGLHLKLITPTKYMHLRIKGLQGLSKKIIKEEAEILVNKNLTERSPSIEILFLLKEHNIPFGYATFTIKDIAEAVNIKYGGIILCASELEYDHYNICKGKYKKALHNCKKEQYIPSDWKKELYNCCFVTDDIIADASILDSVGFPVYLPLNSLPRNKRPTLRHSFPSIYYYTTRYNNFCKSTAHILKFWGTYLLTLWLIAPGNIFPLYLPFAFLAFMAIYDIGCKENDIKALKEKNGRKRNTQNNNDTFLNFIVIRLLWIMVMLIPPFIINPTAGITITIYLSFLCLTFFIHNRLNPQLRIITFYALYLIKGLFPFIVIYPIIHIPVLYILFCICFAATYIPKYTYMKYNNIIKTNEHPVQKILLQPIVSKNIILIILSLVDIRFMTVLVWVNSITIIEFVICHYILKKRPNNA